MDHSFTMTTVPVVRASDTCNPGFRPKCGSAYPLSKQNESNQKKQYGSHRDGNQKHHHKNFLYHININLLSERQSGEELQGERYCHSQPPHQAAICCSITSVWHFIAPIGWLPRRAEIRIHAEVKQFRARQLPQPVCWASTQGRGNCQFCQMPNSLSDNMSVGRTGACESQWLCAASVLGTKSQALTDASAFSNRKAPLLFASL